MSQRAGADAHDSDDFGVVASLRELIALGANMPPSGLQTRPASSTVPGCRLSHLRSRGMEFAETRLYQAGDDVRAIDWRQTARRGRLYTKLFAEEHDRTVMFLVDLGPSMRFGTRVAFKSVIAARAAALLAWMAAAAGARVGGLVWNGSSVQTLRPQARKSGVLPLLHSLSRATTLPPAKATADLTIPLRRLAETPGSGALIVLLSDFSTLDAKAESHLLTLARRGELALIHVYDPFEAMAPPPGRYRLGDGKRGLTLDLHSAAARAAYGAAFAARCALLEQLARRVHASLVPLPTHASLATVLPQVLSRRPASPAVAVPCSL